MRHAGLPQPGIEPVPPAVETWSIYPWTTRGVLDLVIWEVSFSIFHFPFFPTGLLVLGVHVLPQVNKVFMGINISVLGFITISSFIKGDLHNWKLTEQDYTLNTSESDDIYRLGGCP